MIILHNYTCTVCYPVRCCVPCGHHLWVSMWNMGNLRSGDKCWKMLLFNYSISFDSHCTSGRGCWLSRCPCPSVCVSVGVDVTQYNDNNNSAQVALNRYLSHPLVKHSDWVGGNIHMYIPICGFPEWILFRETDMAWGIPWLTERGVRMALMLVTHDNE